MGETKPRPPDGKEANGRLAGGIVLALIGGLTLWGVWPKSPAHTDPRVPAETATCNLYRNGDLTARVTVFDTEADLLAYESAVRKGAEARTPEERDFAHDQAIKVLGRGRPEAAHTELPVLEKHAWAYKLRGGDGAAVYALPEYCH